MIKIFILFRVDGKCTEERIKDGNIKREEEDTHRYKYNYFLTLYRK